MHSEILSAEQSDLFSLLRTARRSGFYLVGGTAIALHIGHRKSIDYDLFLPSPFDSRRISALMGRARMSFSRLFVSRDDETTGEIDGVKITFFYFPFPVEATVDFEGVIKLPDLLSLAAMKAYSMGRRAKWKDYVDLYFLIRDHFSIGTISRKAEQIFGGGFNEKLFREQLHYFENINYQEEVEYLIPNPPTDEEIKEFLRVESLKD